EARLLRLGQRAEVRLPYDPGHALSAEVTFLAPTLAPESRTLQVRLELANPKGELRPGMFVDVAAEVASASGVTVPDDAVIDTGTRRVIFVERAPGVFEPREVEIGLRGSGRAVVLAGVRAGAQVATRANFLLDSEPRRRPAPQAASPPDGRA